MRSRFASFAISIGAVALSLSFLGSTCDLAADECDEPEDNHCTTDNVAVQCKRPGAEAHRQVYRTPCTGKAICSMGADKIPVCATP